jgi:hypothetical protein
MTPAKREFTGSSLIDLGYRDYIAARFLLNNQLIVQGLTLASTAIEKYLKALIVLHLKDDEQYNYHLDNLPKLKAALEKNYKDVTVDFDPVFLSILVNAYKIRYYDKLKEPIRIGLFLNQFIGELDETVHRFETSFNLPSPYKRAARDKDPKLYENNFVLNKEDKKKFMEQPDLAFSIYINVGPSSHHENTVTGKDIQIEYNGHLTEFKDPFEVDWLLERHRK